ncbi:hypothetical protein D3C87_2075140 [compost metagenome]
MGENHHENRLGNDDAGGCFIRELRIVIKTQRLVIGHGGGEIANGKIDKNHGGHVGLH